jgi:hypothetical protein
MDLLLPNQPMSLKVVSALCFTDNAPGAPLLAYLYLCLHGKGRWTAHLESHDPDNFPGTPPSLDVLADCPADDENGSLTLEKALASEMFKEKGLTPHPGPAQPAVRLASLCNRALEQEVAESPFHRELYSRLSEAFAEDASWGASPPTEFFNTCHDVVYGGQWRQGAAPCPLVVAVHDMAAPLQDGLSDLLPQLERLPATQAKLLLSAPLVRQLEQAITSTLAASVKPPMTYRVEHFLQAVKSALLPAMAGATA